MKRRRSCGCRRSCSFKTDSESWGSAARARREAPRPASCAPSRRFSDRRLPRFPLFPSKRLRGEPETEAEDERDGRRRIMTDSPNASSADEVERGRQDGGQQRRTRRGPAASGTTLQAMSMIQRPPVVAMTPRRTAADVPEVRVDRGLCADDRVPRQRERRHELKQAVLEALLAVSSRSAARARRPQASDEVPRVDERRRDLVNETSRMMPPPMPPAYASKMTPIDVKCL